MVMWQIFYFLLTNQNKIIWVLLLREILLLSMKAHFTLSLYYPKSTIFIVTSNIFFDNRICIIQLFLSYENINSNNYSWINFNYIQKNK